MLLFPVDSLALWVLYAWCGISDMLDGPIARKLGTQSDVGAQLDSVSDVVFLLACAVGILPSLHLPPWLLAWAALIAIVKIACYIFGLRSQGLLFEMHSLVNKATGLVLFATIPLVFLTGSPLTAIPACLVATIAAAQEARTAWGAPKTDPLK